MIATYRKRLFEGETVANSSITSKIFDLDTNKGFSIELNVTGAGCAGSVLVEGSNDGSNWVTITGGAATIAGPDSIVFNCPEYYVSMSRLVVTSSNLNTMTLNAFGLAKSY